MATNMYLKFEGPEIKGESTNKGHEDEIEVLSWSHGFMQPTSPTRSGAGSGTVERAHHSDFNVSIYTDSSLDDILKCCWNGTHIDKATVTAYRADGDDNNAPVQYLKIEMEGVIVSNISLGAGGGDIPVVNLSLSYAKVTYTYTDSKGKEGAGGGAQPVSHDLVTAEIA